MDILPELRRAGYPAAGITLLLSLYFALVGTDAAGAALAAAGSALLAALTARGRAAGTRKGPAGKEGEAADEPR